jgi:hypothetical protein
MISEILKPTKGKVVLALAITWAYYFTSIGLALLEQEPGVTVIIPAPTSLDIIFMVIFSFVESIFYYPLSSSIVHAWKRRKTGKKKSGNETVLLVALILVFNPITIRLILSLIFYMLIMMIFLL